MPAEISKNIYNAMARTGLFNIIFRLMVLGFLVFGLLRISFILRFGEVSSLTDNLKTFGLLTFNAFRFDAQVIAYILIPITLWLVVGLFISKELFFSASVKIFQHYFPICYTLVALLSLLDQQFYINFRSHYNPVFFDFFNEEPTILIKSIWNEHPVIWITIGCIIFFWVMRLSVKHIIHIKSTPLFGLPVSTNALPYAFCIFLPLGIRGSVATFPLRAEDTYISERKEINDYVPNAVFMLKKAYCERKKQFKLEAPEEILQQNGFKTLEDAIACYFDITPDSASQRSIEDWVFNTTPKNNIDFHPNVVFIITESWSNRLIDFQSDSLDLLCGMKKHLAEDILFRNFQSSTNGTINAIESLIIGTPYQPLFTSKYRYLHYPTTITAPFKANHYSTSFISGIELSWRNLEEVLPLQQFDHVMGKYEILKQEPSVECNHTWGVYDHCLLDFLANKLEQQSEPNFVLCLTSTSHTPFEFPQNYNLPNFELGDESMKNFSGDPQMVKEYLKGYQYSNRALGDFMDRIKSTPSLAENTIVVITGDHNIRMILPYENEGEQRFQNSVPLYVYLPPKLRETISVDTTRWGSHSDIIPTLAPLIFSNTGYVNMGQNLFDNSRNSDQYYSINVSQVLHGQALSDEEAQRKAKARETMLKFYFQSLFRENEQALLRRH